jgi:hypothetical protein
VHYSWHTHPMRNDSLTHLLQWGSGARPH